MLLPVMAHSVDNRDDADGTDDGFLLEYQVVVGHGEHVIVESFDAGGDRFDRRRLPPGEWRVLIDLDTEQVEARRLIDSAGSDG